MNTQIVSTRPFSLKNNLVYRAVEILIKSYAGSYFFSGDLNLNMIQQGFNYYLYSYKCILY